jgi:hypothetical protein
MNKNELIAELRKLGKEIRQYERGCPEAVVKLKRVGEILDILIEDIKMPLDEVAELTTEVNKAEEKEM